MEKGIMNKILIITIAIILLIGTGSAYSVPEQYKGQTLSDSELFNIANSHTTEPWAQYLINDMGYKYNARNYAQFIVRLQYQSKFPKIVRNNMVKEH